MTAATQTAAPYTCTEEEARALTAEIRGRANDLWRLLSRAYEIRAWAALKHPTWESYVRAEFDIGRSRSYQLLDQAKVVREIEAAAGVHSVDVSEAVARDIKPRLSEVTEQVREAVADVPEPERPAVVAEVVRDAREQFIADRRSGEVLSPEAWANADAPGGEVASGLLADGAAPSPPGPDGWSPSDALDHKPKRPAASKPARPSTVEESFTEAALELRKAVDRVERLSADGRFASYAAKIGAKHRGGLDYAIEGLKIVQIRLRAGVKT